MFTLSSNASIMAGGELWSASIDSEASSSTTTTDNESVDNMPDFQASATIFPPNTTINTLSYSSLPSLLWSGGLFSTISQVGLFQFKNIMDAYAAATTPAKKSTLRSGESYYYIMLIGAASAHRGKGLAPALIRKLQERAQKDGKPIWLEASNLGARKVYLKVGFEDLGEIRLGKGECGTDGEVASGEEAVGVPMWPMVWWPEGYVREAA
jgi:ribosomal protein S18 acetylase RimI-like enzyme